MKEFEAYPNNGVENWMQFYQHSLRFGILPISLTSKDKFYSPPTGGPPKFVIEEELTLIGMREDSFLWSSCQIGKKTIPATGIFQWTFKIMGKGGIMFALAENSWDFSAKYLII